MRKNLVFSGVDLDDVRMELIKISTYCQDILEARVRSVLYDQLNITRDIPMDEVIRGKKFDKLTSTFTFCVLLQDRILSMYCCCV